MKSVAPDHPDLQVRKRWGDTKVRKTARVSGISPRMELKSFNNDIDTLERAVKERVFFVKNDLGEFVEPPKPAPHHFRKAMLATEKLLVRRLPKTAPLSRDAFVETFRGRKREIYAKAVESLSSQSVTQRDAGVQVFVKFEKTDYTRKKDPVPRVISPRNPRYNVEVGRYLRTIEEPLFHSLSQLFEGKRTVFKGMNAADSGRAMYDLWSSFRKPVAVGLDASRFDQHVSKCALQWEHAIYPQCFTSSGDRAELRRLLKWQVHNKCVGYCADGRIKYTKEGTRMSGDMNTSLGNCVLMCSMIKQYSLDRGVRTLLANNGDDCVVFMEADELARFSSGLDEWFRAMGFNMVVEPPCYQFEEIEFCQTHPIYVGPKHSDYLMVRHPKWALAKDSMCIHGFPTSKIYKAWLDAVGTGGLAMTGGVPIFQDFYSTYCKYGVRGKTHFHEQSWGVRSLQQGMVRKYGAVLPETRASFYWAFGVLPDEQLAIEDFYRGVKLDEAWRDELEFQPLLPL
ncbi:hypothetical protein 2 [Hubei tombus-like virus 5]|uniref:hypothetical protein 2 n=1 Tax=Hubei tombus-like virus 5 TaxID=1923292 RepID=UPI00090AB9C7|nr:hypothetical protein 2 [Hubei tombus-like virus 5]APG76465.1 hypothetical protein 2 [Hubei tombus-like virus 5]